MSIFVNELGSDLFPQLLANMHQIIEYANDDSIIHRINFNLDTQGVTPRKQVAVMSVHDEVSYCPACRTTLVATIFRVAVICPIIQVPHCIRVFFYFVWFVFINHIFQFYYELCTYCNILDIYLS